MEYLNEDKQKKARRAYYKEPAQESQSLEKIVKNPEEAGWKPLFSLPVPSFFVNFLFERGYLTQEDALSKPAETWDLYSGLVEVYPINKQEKLYLINNPGTRTLTGVLRHEVKNINSSAERFAELFPKILPGQDYSIDGIAAALIKSKDEVRKSESDETKVMFDYTKQEVSSNQMQLAKHLGWYDPEKIKNIGTNSIFATLVLEGLAGIIGGAVLFEPKFGNYLSSALAGGFLSAIFGMLPTIMFGVISTATISNYFDKTRITSNINKLKSKIRKQQKIANQIKQEYKYAKTFDDSTEAAIKMHNQNILLHKYWAVLHEVITHNCASITYSQQYKPGSKDCASEEDAKNKVLDFFREKVLS
ncbi:MAG: hypothetical protein QW666_04145, partial [Candidatus Woesearchaeota archaeon]